MMGALLDPNELLQFIGLCVILGLFLVWFYHEPCYEALIGAFGTLLAIVAIYRIGNIQLSGVIALVIVVTALYGHRIIKHKAKLSIRKFEAALTRILVVYFLLTSILSPHLATLLSPNAAASCIRNHDGVWQGRTDQGHPISFRIRGNALQELKVKFHWSNSWVTKEITARWNTELNDGYLEKEQNFGALSIKVSGNFSSCPATGSLTISKNFSDSAEDIGQVWFQWKANLQTNEDRTVALLQEVAQ